MASKYPHGCCTTLSDGRTISVMESEEGVTSIEIWSPDDRMKYRIGPDQITRLDFDRASGNPLLAAEYMEIPTDG